MNSLTNLRILQSSCIRLLAGSLVWLVGLTVLPGAAPSFQVLHTFGTNVMGFYPQAKLTAGPDEFLYGTTSDGGAANRGQVFKVKPDTNTTQLYFDTTSLGHPARLYRLVPVP